MSVVIRFASLVVGASALPGGSALAHSVSEHAQQRMLIGDGWDAAWIGAEHMLTGYDHLLFLLGVMLFLTRGTQIVTFITAFTVGHTITLLFATLAGVNANPFIIDAVIALTVAYKAIENMDGFRRWLGFTPPNLLTMVFVFGLIHGFGLSTRLQEMTLARDPDIVPKILAFNVGVELGQIAALSAMVLAVNVWRASGGFVVFARATNAVLIAGGAALFAMQVHGYLGSDAARSRSPWTASGKPTISCAPPRRSWCRPKS